VPAQANLSNFEILNFFKHFFPGHKSEIDSSIKDKDFSRDRKLTLPVVLALLINMVRPGKRVGYQCVINRFFSDTGALANKDSSVKPPDQAAFHRARKKLPLDVIQGLFEKAVCMATSLAGRFASLTWKGHRVLAIDGTRKNMPYSPELGDFFGIPSGACCPQMLVCTLYDVLAKIPLNCVAAHHGTSERALAEILFESLKAGDLLLMDRGFPGFRLFDDLLKTGADFLVRLPLQGLFGAVRAFLDKGRVDGIVTIRPSQSVIREYRLEGLPDPKPITLRIVKASLPNGKKILFATTLLDAALYSRSDLVDLYHMRWEQEEHFKLIKGLLEAENFRGKSSQLVSQELLAINLYCLLTRILMLQSALIHNISPDTVAQKPAFLAVSRFLDRIWKSETIDQCHHWLRCCLEEMSWGKYKKRPNRSFPRKFKR
jgi:Transposase DDE domain